MIDGGIVDVPHAESFCYPACPLCVHLLKENDIRLPQRRVGGKSCDRAVNVPRKLDVERDDPDLARTITSPDCRISGYARIPGSVTGRVVAACPASHDPEQEQYRIEPPDQHRFSTVMLLISFRELDEVPQVSIQVLEHHNGPV